MHKLKIRLSKEYLLAALVILPYFEGGRLKAALRIELNGQSYLPTIIFLMLAVWIFVLFLNITRSKKLQLRSYSLLFGALCSYSLITILYSREVVTSLSVWIWLCFPMILSLTIIHYCRASNFDYGKVVVGMICWFALYTIAVLANNIIRYGLFSDESFRLYSRAGGAVIFGYTVAVFFSLCLCYKKRFPLPVYYAILGVFTVAAVGTGSRGAVWPIAALWIFNFLFEKITLRRIVMGIILAILFAAGGSLELDLFSSLSSSNLSLLNRLINLSTGIRGITLFNILDQFFHQNCFLSIFGYGLGKFFPYQHWALWIEDMARNTFTYHGRLFLVQPHNSFAYILVEAGLIGFVLWCSIFVKEVKCLSKRYRSDDRCIQQVIFVGVVIFVNMLDSIFFVQPGVAMVFWLLLLLVYEDHSKKAYSS